VVVLKRNKKKIDREYPGTLKCPSSKNTTEEGKKNEHS